MFSWRWSGRQAYQSLGVALGSGGGGGGDGGGGGEGDGDGEGDGEGDGDGDDLFCNKHDEQKHEKRNIIVKYVWPQSIHPL